MQYDKNGTMLIWKEIMLKLYFYFILFFLNINLLSGQVIVTAERYLEMVSNRFSEIRDFEANVIIRSGNSDMTGTISYLAPSFFRIEFSNPAGQVMIFNGESLTIYVPEFSAVLLQNINQSGRNRAPSSNTQGLNQLRRNYIPSYLISPNAVPLDSNSRENVIKLRLTRRSASEGFKEIILSINPDTRLIRRMEGTTIADETVSFDFINTIINQGISEQRFVFVPPASAEIYNNFLFSGSN
jgi:outer membrane lipoprotein-sorting protein